MSAFIETLLRLKARAEQEANSQDKDTMPNPLAGLVGPEELHYNPLRDKPIIGGAINRAVNIPTHAAGLVLEGTGEAAKGIGGTVALLGALADKYANPYKQEDVGRDAERILAEGFRPGRALEAARTSENDATSYAAGALELAADPSNYIGGIGAAGKALRAAGGASGVAGRGLQGTAAIIDAANRLPFAPLGLIPGRPGARIRQSLTEIPEYLRTDDTQEIAPLVQAVSESLADGVPKATPLASLAESGMRTPINTGNLPDEVDTANWKARERATGLLPEGTPGKIERPDSAAYIRQALLANLDADHGIKHPRLPRATGAARPDSLSVTVGEVAEDAPLEAELPGFVKQLEQARDAGLEGFSDRVTDKGHWRRGQKPTEPLADPLDSFEGMQAEALRLRDELGRMPTPSEVRYRTGSGVTQTQDIMEYLDEADAPAHADLDRMDALRGREAIDNITGIMKSIYGTSNNLESISGVGSFTGEGRLVTKEGKDETRGLLQYLLTRGDMTKEQADELKNTLFSTPRKPRNASVPPETVPVGGVAEAPTADAGQALRDLALDPQFAGQELPGANYFAKRVGLSNEAVVAGLSGLADEGALGRMGEWFAVKPSAAPANPVDDLFGTVAEQNPLGMKDMPVVASSAEAVIVSRKADGGYTVTHAPTGLGITDAPTRAEALEYAKDLNASGIDMSFTSSGPESKSEITGMAHTVQGTMARLADERHTRVDVGDVKSMTPYEKTVWKRDQANTGAPPLADPRDPGIGYLPTRLGVSASGAGIGAVAGAIGADTEDENRQDDFGGLIGGALTGAAVGAGLASPTGVRNIKFGRELVIDAGNAQVEAFASGSKDMTWANFAGSWSGQTVQHVKNLLQEPISSIPQLLNEGGKLSDVLDNAKSVKDLYNAGLRGAKLVPKSVTDIMDTVGLGGAYVDLGTEAFAEMTGQLGKDLNPFLSGFFGLVQSAATPLGAVPVVGALAKAGLETLAPMRRVIHTTIDGVTKAAFRSAIFVPAMEDALEDAAYLFGDSVLQRTGKQLALPADGKFSPKDVGAALSGVPISTRDLLVREWGQYVQAAQKTGEQGAKDAFGNFNKLDPKTATKTQEVLSGAEGGLRKVVAFSSWYLRAMPIAAKIAADHPALTLATLGLYLDQARDTEEQGLPAYMAGKMPFDSNTPVVGKLADVMTPGNAHANGLANFASAVMPFRTETIAADESKPDDTKFQTIERWFERAGLGFNPLVKAVMYATNNDWQRPGALSRTAGIEQSFDGPTIASAAQGPLDAVRKMAGGNISTTTPIEKRLAQIFYQKTGMRIGDPAAAQLAAATLDPEHPWYKQASEEVKGAGRAKNIAGLISPVDVMANNDLDVEILKARKANPDANKPTQMTPDQAGQEALFKKLYPLQYAISKQNEPRPDPLTQIYRGADVRGRSYQALTAWEEENADMKRFVPTYYGAARKEIMRELGIEPKY